MLTFSLLGPVALLKEDVILGPFRSPKEMALLIYLAHTGQPQSRDFMAEFLWEDRSPEQARSNLRTVLTRLRKQLGEDELVISRKTLSLTQENLARVDSARLTAALSALEHVDSAEKAAHLTQLLAAYPGDFLADFHVMDAPAFDQWVLTSREQIRRRVVAAYRDLGDYLLSAGEVEAGVAVARRWLQVDHLDEAAHKLLIQFLLKTGNRAVAVAHYEECVALLRAELDAEPDAELTATIEESTATPRPFIALDVPVRPRHNLPAVYDQLFGRQQIQDEIHSRLDQPWCRLVTLVGQGGVGKTRLAAAIARHRVDKYRDGVWLVELADVDPDDDDLAEAIAIEMASAVDLRLSGSAKPVDQLLDFLRHRQTLLVLDNFEHLLGGVQIVLDLIGRCDGLQMLVTSREALRLRAEWVCDLAGLNYPGGEQDETPSAAVELFVARRAQQNRTQLSADNLAAVRGICRMVEGLPLAIELAAALTHDASSREIANQLNAGFDALAASLRDVPARHHSLRIVFEMSWRTLPPYLQQRLARLSVFHGGFTEDAAQQIADVDPAHLVLLCDKSLLSFSPSANRYAIHPVVRAYAAEKLDEAGPILQEHARYFLALLASHADALQRDKPQLSVAALEVEIDNLRAAWRTGLAQQLIEPLTAALTPLSIYYQLRGLSLEAEAAMHNAVDVASTWGAEGATLLGRAGMERARFQNRLGRYRPAIETVQGAMQAVAHTNDQWAEAMATIFWGESLWRLGEFDVAEDRFSHALHIGHTIESTSIIGWCHHQLGIVNDIRNRYDAALDHLRQACDAWRSEDNAQLLSSSLNSLGLVYYHKGDLPNAQQAMEQSLVLCNQIDYRHLQSMLLNNLSILATDQADYLRAYHYLHLALDLATTSGNLTSQGEIYNNLARNYFMRGQADLAAKNAAQGLEIAESLGNRILLVDTLINLANARNAQGDLAQAESIFNQAMTITRQDNLPYAECIVLIGLAETLSKADERRAKEYSTAAIDLAQTLQNPSLLERATAIHNYLSVSV